MRRLEVPVLPWAPDARGLEACAMEAEWLLTDGLGGYALGTVAWCNTRKYHGLLIPNLPHLGRTVVLSRLEDELWVGDQRQQLHGIELDGGVLLLPGLSVTRSFWLEGHVPVWELNALGVNLERRVVASHGQPTMAVVYTHRGGPAARLTLRPWPACRPHDRDPTTHPERFEAKAHLQGVAVDLPLGVGELRLGLSRGSIGRFHFAPQVGAAAYYRVEAARGHQAVEGLVSPGELEVMLQPGQSVALIATMAGWDALDVDAPRLLSAASTRALSIIERSPSELNDRLGARLSLAAADFIIDPPQRRGHALSVIAGYPWFTDWGRDTMISLEGLTLCTNRHGDARSILRMFSEHVRDGLMPNYFPEGANSGVYHTADATLWFFHAIERYLAHTGDLQLLHELWPTLEGIVHKHLEGTRYNIRVDPDDGLLTQGETGYQLTWMDAKVGDWVVTPRRGKAVELSALWYNALRLMGGWAPHVRGDAAFFARHAERCAKSFNARFFNPETGCLFDVIDGPVGHEPCIRPNQVFAISLSHPVLDRARWEPVLATVRRDLLTPYGLRTLSPQDPAYQPYYTGDLRSRDAAYHQGTVWPWLLGHYVDAVVKTYGPAPEVHELLKGLEHHLAQGGLGTLSEIFDASEPYHARGCVAQAWSVAELVRLTHHLRRPRETVSPSRGSGKSATPQ